MLSWATNQFEKLSQTVAPPPEEPAGKFAYCCQRGDEDGATQLVSQLPNGMETIVVPNKGQSPLHVACLHSMLKLTKFLLMQPGVSVAKPDAEGNTALHCACMSSSNSGIEVVKLLVQDMGADVSQKNSAGQTPYDVANLNVIRQYLLPLQLQKETQEALANGGKGLIPGMDMGGLKVSYSGPPPPTMAGGMPPPSSGGGMPPPSSGGGIPPQAPLSGTGMAPPILAGGMPPPPMSGGMPPPPMSGGMPPSISENAPSTAPIPTTTEVSSASAVPPAPSSGQHSYARTGSSSAAIYKPSTGRSYKADGFHSSSSDKRLQEKYGHSTGGGAYAIPPPPKSGESMGAPPSSTGSVGVLGSTSSIASSTSSNPGSNPYAGGYSAFRAGGVGGGSRYVSYDAVTGTQAQVPTNRGYNRSASGGYSAYAQQPIPNAAVFQAPMGAVQSAPASAPVLAQSYAPQSTAAATFQPPPTVDQAAAVNQQYDASQHQPYNGQVAAPSTGYQGAVPPTVTTMAQPAIATGATNAATPQNPNDVVAANVFATPHPPETITPTAQTAAAAAPASNLTQDNTVASQGFGAPPIMTTSFDTSSPTKGITSVGAPGAAAATFSSPQAAAVAAFSSPPTSTNPTPTAADPAAAASAFAANPPAEAKAEVTAEAAFASPPAETTNPISAQEAFATPPAAAATEESAVAEEPPTMSSAPQVTTQSQTPANDLTETSEAFSDVPLNDPPISSTAPSTISGGGGLPPPPIGFTTSSTPTAAADLFATAPPTS